MCFICAQYNENIITRYDAEMLIREHRFTVGEEHARLVTEALRSDTDVVEPDTAAPADAAPREQPVPGPDTDDSTEDDYAQFWGDYNAGFLYTYTDGADWNAED